MKTYVIGVDPGDSTGIAFFSLEEDQQLQLVVARQGDPDAMLRWIEVILEQGASHGARVEIALERYIDNRRVKTHQPTAQQVIGAVKRTAHVYDIEPVEQGPADAHACASNAFLKKNRFFQTKETVGCPDANDANMAVRHALLLIMKKHASYFSGLQRA